MGPIAVGGVGGSGTRVVADLLQKLGFYLGGDLNRALDNQWFALLFKRPRWLDECRRRDDAPVFRALQLFERAMTTGLASGVGRAERRLVEDAVAESAASPWPMGAGRQEARTLLASAAPAPGTHRGWGWKEPNTHVLLDYVRRYFPTVRYVHVIRHGLDMAFSSNRQQLRNWGALYGVPWPADEAAVPQAALQFWLRANREAAERGREWLGERFHLLRIDDLFVDPLRATRELTAFLGLSVGDDEAVRLIGDVVAPPSVGRYRREDLSRFSPDDVDGVRAFGFAVEP